MKAIAVDIGNVSVAIDTSAFPRALGLAELTAEMRDVCRQVEWGLISEEVFFRKASALFPQRTEAWLRDAFDSILLEPIPGMEDALEQLTANGWQVVFFSDISPMHLEGFRRRFRNADKYAGIYSFDVGAWKPSPKMFAAFEEKYALPELYIDDRENLVAAALEHGWNARRFTGVEELEDYLKQ